MIYESTLTNELNHVVEKTMRSSNSDTGDARERDTHISNKIFACVVILIENNTVVVVARIFGLRSSEIREFLEEQGTVDVFASTLAERKTSTCQWAQNK